jgi:hypothetical protein
MCQRGTTRGTVTTAVMTNDAAEDWMADVRSMMVCALAICNTDALSIATMLRHLRFFCKLISHSSCQQPPLSMEVFLIGFGITAGALGYKFWTAKKLTVACPATGPVPQNKIRICVAGTYGPHDARAHKIASTIAAAQPDKSVAGHHYAIRSRFLLCFCD